MMQLHLFISGDVQGVGFRQFVRHWARKIGVVGWVRNLDDGRVEAVLQGEKDKVDQVLRLCKKGPGIATVSGVEIQEESVGEQYNEFTILR